jgi:metal-responsive CopG/Arc/MetJ family transcriptional regulator
MVKGLKFMLGATVSPELVREIDAFRGEVPRSRVVERALKQYLQSVSTKNLQSPQAIGTRVGSTAITTTTPEHAGTPAADNLSNMATHGGSQRYSGDADANDK